MRTILFASAIAAALGVTSLAQAATTTYNITWSGDAFGNAAVAHGFITVDASLPALAFTDVLLPDPRVSDLSIDVSGSFGGNGHFGLADFVHVYFWAPAALNLGTELIGQDLGNGCTYGDFGGACGFGGSGDFNIFSTDGAPSGLIFFDLQTAGGDQMLVTSISPASVGGVPEPATWALMVGGFALAGSALRRRQTLAA